MNPLIEFAVEFATKQHEGQTRWDKTPYINHPIAVMDLAIDFYRKDAFSLYGEFYKIAAEQYTGPIKDYESYIGIVALFHDICEDVENYKNKEYNLVYDFFAFLHKNSIIYHLDDYALILALRTLNKNYYKSYLDFILAAKSNSLAKIVKKADLTHNLSDLTKGSMKQKYELALYILDN